MPCTLVGKLHENQYLFRRRSFSLKEKSCIIKIYYIFSEAMTLLHPVICIWSGKKGLPRTGMDLKMTCEDGRGHYLIKECMQ
ncbi:hypothetical protein DXC92_10095 [Clostridiales bacterium TF09-2AC]|nr:hypothetical protein DXC92_10095 [Clostridiales bacterium TF09-2AC]